MDFVWQYNKYYETKPLAYLPQDLPKKKTAALYPTDEQLRYINDGFVIHNKETLQRLRGGKISHANDIVPTSSVDLYVWQN